MGEEYLSTSVHVIRINWNELPTCSITFGAYTKQNRHEVSRIAFAIRKIANKFASPATALPVSYLSLLYGIKFAQSFWIPIPARSLTIVDL